MKFGVVGCAGIWFCNGTLMAESVGNVERPLMYSRFRQHGNRLSRELLESRAQDV